MVKTREVNSRLIGDNIYNKSAGGQSVTHTIVPGGTWSFGLRMQNDGEATDDLRVKSAFKGDQGSFSLRIFYGYYDVTAAVFGGGLLLPDVPVGEDRAIAVQFRADAAVLSGDFSWLMLALTSEAAPELDDRVRVGVSVP